MAANITATVKQVKGSGFCVTASSTDLTTAQAVVAAVTGKSHWIKSITINCIVATQITIRDNTGTPVVILGLVNFTTTAPGFYHITFDEPIQVAAGKAVMALAADICAVSVVIQGKTE